MTQQTITVANASELNAALATATGGETILLAAGNYGKLSLSGTQFASNVTIQSADPNAMAEFSEVRIDQASNVTFDTIMFDYDFSSGDYHFQSAFKVSNSSSITFIDSVFDGDVSSGTGTSIDGKGYGTGLSITGSTNVDVIGTVFSKWWKGVIVTKSDDIDIVGNDIHSIRSDGLVFDNVDNVLIEKNYIHDFGGAVGAGDHRDMIQVQRATGGGSDNITIRDNVFDMGAGDYTQTIWMGGDGKDISDPNIIHHNVMIENNVIYNGHFHGVSIYGVDGLHVTKNTILHVDEKTLTGGVEIPVINISAGSKNVTIDYNVTSLINNNNGQADWNVSNNAIVQPSEYDQMFFYHATAQADGYNQYGVQTGSLVDTLNAGSTLVDGYPFSNTSWVGTATSTGTGSTGTGTTGGTTGTTTTTDTSGTGTTTTTDTSGTSAGNADTSGTETTASTEDASGTSAGNADTSGTETTTASTTDTSGTSAGNADTSGTETTTASTTDTSGTSAGNADTSGTETTTASTEDTSGTSAGSTETSGTETNPQTPMVFDDFVLDIAGLPNNDQASLKGDATVVGNSIQFDGHRDWAKIGRLNEFEDSEQIAFTVEFTRNKANTGDQWLVWNHTKLGLNLTADGGLIAHVRNNDSPGNMGFRDGFKVDNLGLNDTETHQITLMLDQTADRLQVVVDGELVLEETDTDFQFSGGKQWGWSIGTSWGRYVDGEVSDFAIDDEVHFIEDQSVLNDDLFA